MFYDSSAKSLLATAVLLDDFNLIGRRLYAGRILGKSEHLAFFRREAKRATWSAAGRAIVCME